MDKPLYSIIKHIEYGTNLHIGVLFFKDYGNKMCEVPRRHEIHQSPVCDAFKNASRNSFFRCVRCRNLAIRKALTSKTPFGGLCVNGIYEYTHPIVIGGDVACIIFIGNILGDGSLQKISAHSDGALPPTDTLQADFSPDMCKSLCETLENYILFLLEKYRDTNKDENTLIKNIKRYIDCNIEYGVDIHSIAAAFHYNPRYLGRLFKKETGTMLGDYINSRRLKRARELLRESPRSILDISNETGFNNVTYFNSLFKKSEGMTPREYRKLHQNLKALL